MFIATLLLSSALVGELKNVKNSYPNLWGASGTLRTTTAIPNEATTFGVQLLGSFFTSSDFIADRKQSRSRARLNGSYTFSTEFPLEAYAGILYSFNENSTTAGSRTITTVLENLNAGARFGKSMIEDTLYFGGYGQLVGFSGTRSLRNVSGGDKQSRGPFVSGSAGFITTVEMKKKHPDFPLRTDFNVGWRLPNGNLNGALDADDFNRFSLDSFRYQAIEAHLSGQLMYEMLKPFMELSTEYAMFTGKDTVKFSDNRQTITFGTRVTPVEAFAFLAAFDIGLNGPSQRRAVGIPRNPPYEVHLGLQFQTLGKALSGQVGSVRGYVTDADTGEPLSNTPVTLGGPIPRSTQTDESGNYSFEDLNNGSYDLHVERKGFTPLTKTFSVRNGGDVVLDMSLEKAGPGKGGLLASVIDKETQQPIPKAYVTVSGTDSTLSTDGQGQLRVKDLPEGTQNIHVEASGYQPGDFVVEIFPNDTLKQTLYLQKAAPQTGNCVGVIKNPDGTPLTAVITEKSGGSPFATNPLNGEFTQSMYAGVHSLKIQAENYLPKEVDCDVKPGETTKLEITLEKPKQAVVVDNKIILPDAIYFEFNKDVIKQESFPTLNQVVQILVKPIQFEKLEIDGHTDSVGSDAYNVDLSRRRAKSVVRYLIAKGVNAKKLEARGFGETKPIATNLTDEGRAENRRVEFNLIRGEAGSISQPTPASAPKAQPQAAPKVEPKEEPVEEEPTEELNDSQTPEPSDLQE